jgi:hypothetical protein
MVVASPEFAGSHLVEYEASLLSNWSKMQLGEYEGKWIAWRNEVVDHADDLSSLLKSYPFNRPLFAFVSFKARA